MMDDNAKDVKIPAVVGGLATTNLYNHGDSVL